MNSTLGAGLKGEGGSERSSKTGEYEGEGRSTRSSGSGEYGGVSGAILYVRREEIEGAGNGEDGEGEEALEENDLPPEVFPETIRTVTMGARFSRDVNFAH
ncbi:uncharacterized protein LOC120359560 [Solenopsis invicta]|uniref:uncharacterized protein LOC120359560 n=1 Tax=Solenopsis invicta TaxID=13686 RepID=UPI00193E2427|nr:uncharacterized protein LOC120359560 [Solenopsis invicta]